MGNNNNLSFEERAAELVSKMTLEEKISQLSNTGAPIPRLNIPAYAYWSEASHGVFSPFKLKEMPVTSYPVCLALSQTWNPEMVKNVAKGISDEARAYYNKDGDELHYYNPTINLERDPRNGRSDENFGEDAYLAGELGASYIEGFQDREGEYVKAVATPKHYALNSSENNRHKGSSNADEATIREYYARVFEKAVEKGKAESLMTSYNRINGVPASANDILLTTLLREEWGFDGFVVSDCGAVGDTYNSPMFNMATTGKNGHYYVKSSEEASAITLSAGTDMTCGTEHKMSLMNAVNQGLIEEGILDRALIRIFTSRFRLGLFESDDQKPYLDRTPDIICSEKMNKLAVDSANESIVLLKNDKGLLPLKKDGVKKVLVVGPNAIYRELGGYSAGSANPSVDTIINVMALDGIKKELEDSQIEVSYEKGWMTNKEKNAGSTAGLLPGVDMGEMITGLLGPDVDLEQVMKVFTAPPKHQPIDNQIGMTDEELMESALKAAADADYVIVIAGTDSTNAAEEYDRTEITLPYDQDEKIQKLLAVNDNTVVVLVALSSMTGEFFEKAHTVVNAHYAGQEQGTAIANVLFGKVNPSGKLTTTWYKDVNDLPHINDYGLCCQDTLDGKARTYMYFKGDVLFPFGHGLSYTSFDYSNIKVSKAELDANDTLEISVDVTNVGSYDGAEVVELYASKCCGPNEDEKKPIRQLKAFQKIFLKTGETKTVTLSVPLKEISFWSAFYKKMVVEEGEYRIEIGRSSADIVWNQTVQISGKWNAGIRTVYLTSDKQVLSIGESTQINCSVTLEDATHLKANEYKVTYSSSNPSVVETDEKGTITAKESGVAEVTVTAEYQSSVKSRKLAFAVK